MRMKDATRLIDEISKALDDPPYWSREFWRSKAAALAEHCNLHPREEWREDDHDVLWYRLPIKEPPYCGTPNSSDWPECPHGETEPCDCRVQDDQRPLLKSGYYTHWQRLPPLPQSAGETQ